MGKVMVIVATAVVGIALLSCDAPQPSAGHSATITPMVYEPLAPVVRAPLSPPAGYASPPPPTNLPTPLAPHASSVNESGEARIDAWRASRRWAAVTGEGCIVVEQNPQTNVAAPSDAAKVKVEKCSKEDANQSTAQPEELTGY
jgi:hypothetical protein